MKLNHSTIPQSLSKCREIPLSHQANEARVERKHRALKGRGRKGVRIQSDDWDIAIKAADFSSILWPIWNNAAHLRSVMVEYHSIQVSTVVVLDEILSGVRGLQTPCSKAFMLEQSLVQSKQHLQKHRQEKREKVKDSRNQNNKD